MPGGGAGPATPGGAGGPGGATSPGGGAALPTHHGKTASALLKIQWSYPVFRTEEPKAGAAPGGTVAKRAEGPLPEKEAFLHLAGTDRRPLLVLRECKTCNGTDKALLSVAEDNTRTFVMSRWFHCVKLPEHVLEKTHAFHALFDEPHPPHLFFADWDGSDIVPLKGDQSRTELWDAMGAVLARCYEREAQPATAEIEKILAQYDVLDARLEQIRKQVEKLAEDEGPKSAKMKGLQKDLDKARKDLEALKRREAEASDLGLKQEQREPATPAGA